MTLGVKPRFCRHCEKGEPEVRFAGLNRTICMKCRGDRSGRVRSERVLERRSRARDIRQHCRENGKHLAWVRSHSCCVGSPHCGSYVHAHHVRKGTGGGTAMKPADRFTVPLCPTHHLELHQRGADTFERKYSLNLLELADALAEVSPYLKEGPAPAGDMP